MAGSLCTGSKTAIIVTALCAVAIAFLPHALKGWTLILSIPVALVIPLTLSAILDVVSGIFPGLYNASDSSIGARQILWNSAGRLFAESPFMGLGFGGWEEQVNRRYPPHNFIIAAWAYSGVVAAIVVVAFVVASLVVALRVAAAQSTVYHRRTAILALCAIAWVFLHGMADNTSVYGEQRSMFLFALAFGYLYAMKHQSQEQAENPVRTTNGAPLPARISDRTSLTGLRAHR
ncbi:O-antigen ligase family protein [Mycobacterium sp. 852013-51886_SCH5428379]|uniref:O-antigen ligase family protein n=1 Tax=Mycobacterium sp. 852013-51886_SCH5428379 TaxID=1834111 RepID=UPI0035177EBE